MPLVLPAPLELFANQVLTNRGVRSDVSHYVAEGLIQASVRGVDSHGVRLLPHYVRALEAGRLNPEPNYEFDKTSTTTGKLDADHTFGHASGAEGMSRAIEMAQNDGMGSVAVHNSSHFGAAAYFSLMAAERGMIGFSFTHADSLVLSTGGSRPYFGTNPICFAAPCGAEGPFCLDMATSTVTWNKMLKVSGDTGEIPEGWGVDTDGIDTQDPKLIAALHPAAGHKGYGLGMMVDVLCGVLTGMPFGRSISRMYTDPLEQKRNLGHFFMAINIKNFLDLPNFESSMFRMMEQLRSEPALIPGEPVQVAGDPEKHAARLRSETGIELSPIEVDELKSLADLCGVSFPSIQEENVKQ